MKKRVLCIVGTRPEAIKMAPVIEALRRRPDHFETLVCATGQHRGMLDQVLDLFGVRPDFDLDLMKPDQGLIDVTSTALLRLGETYAKCLPDIVVAQGDTTSTFAASLAAYYHRISVAHVEAGLRSGDKFQPFPEEGNRRLTDELSDWLFAPTEEARQHLLSEGYAPASVVVTGNTVVDALFAVRGRLDEPDWKKRIEAFSAEHGLDRGRLVLVTGHRRENFGEPIRNVCRALRTLASRPDIRVVYPAHPNPNVQSAVAEILGDSDVRVTPPLDYAVFSWLLLHAHLVLTDSGGIQEEASVLGKPTLVLRNTTERPEAVNAGVAKIVGTNEQCILDEATRLLDDSEYFAAMARATNVFGDGRASERIADALAG